MIQLFVPDFGWKSQLMIEIFQMDQSGKLKISDLATEYFCKVKSPDEADWIVIPIFISSLTTEAGKSLIRENHELAQRLNKPFAVFSNSDLIVDPGVSPLFIFTPGAYASIKGQVELPAILPYDPLVRWINEEWKPITVFDKPGLGFCGQATRNPLKLIKDFYTIESLRQKKRNNNSPFLFIPRFLPAFERGRLLHHLEKSRLVKPEFILRTYYKGGASSDLEKERVEEEFFRNIYSNLFTLCLRGMGNYSVRFYQTLAMGRIPVLIDTDSVLPFARSIEYKELIVRVPYEKRSQADKFIVEFLKDKSPEDLAQIQQQCRSIWEQYFTAKGMIQNIAAEMKALHI